MPENDGADIIVTKSGATADFCIDGIDHLITKEIIKRICVDVLKKANYGELLLWKLLLDQ